jgi:large subunit ribosomal protein L18
VYRTNKYIYAQGIDDVEGRTLAAASSQETGLRSENLNLAAAAKVGEAIATRAKDAGVTGVVFDRGGYKFHGKVKALADAAREAGLEF